VILHPAIDPGPIPAAQRAAVSACSRALPAGAAWAAMCLSCDRLAINGYWIADGRLFLCDDCAGDVVAAYGDAHKLLIDQPPGPGEVSIRLLFSPDDGAAQLDAEITPEPADPEGEIALLEQAAVGLCAYLESYISAMHADAELQERPEDGAPA
jgi:hypothetical protein